MITVQRDRAPESGVHEAAKRLAVLRPYLDGDAPLARAPADAGVPLRTARRWLARYREAGPADRNVPISARARSRPTWSS